MIRFVCCFYNLYRKITKIQQSSVLDSTFGDESVSNCGGSLVATSEDQILSSPNYPLPYENNVICTWIITPEIEGEQIEIHIDAIDTEACCDAIDVSVR